MNRILVATDFSSRSDRALRRATLIARRTGAALTLLHVVDAEEPPRLIAANQTEALSLLYETAETLRSGDGIEASPLVAIDDVAAGVLEAAEKIEADLIILGPHRKRVSDIFIGTTVERVVRRTRRPLLIAVPTPTAPYGRTLLALDFDEASRSAGRAALSMGIFDNTNVTIMHAFDTPAAGMLRRASETTDAIDHYVANERSQAIDRLQELVRELGLPPSQHRVATIKGTAAGSIIESALSEHADLIVLGTNQRKGFERLLIGSVTENVIRDAHRDVLIIPSDQG